MVRDTHEFFIAAARAQCEMSIKNTAVGKWLGQALNRIEQLTAERDRLREALEKIADYHDCDPVFLALIELATQALKGGES